MPLTNWIFILFIALLTITFICTRSPANWSLQHRTRRRTGTRLLAQAVYALWAAALLAARGLFMVDGLNGLTPNPQIVLAMILLLLGCSAYWLVRGGRLFKPLRLFEAC
ncbi:hypothetical protein [Paraburkholderia hayleyella]|uniref:hypothetical protein n=1 Tax=Paraburkholderia hayleyella TaxID=2152889 RepID=UPI00129144C6|nr:hypothetical protein [Paraburkholderia hayleyella]